MSLLRAEIEALGARACYVRQENAGPGAVRNQGWSLAKGDYIAFLDSDDLFLPEKLRLQLHHMEQAGAAFSHSSYFRHWRGTKEIAYMRSGELNKFPNIIGSCGIATPTVMVRRALVEEGLCFPTDFNFGADVCLWLSIASRCGVLGLGQPLSVVRAQPDSAAYDRDKAMAGVDNILSFVEGREELRVHTDEVKRLRALRREIAST